jgi:hypothetical protein
MEISLGKGGNMGGVRNSASATDAIGNEPAEFAQALRLVRAPCQFRVLRQIRA